MESYSGLFVNKYVVCVVVDILGIFSVSDIDAFKDKQF